MLCGHHTVQLVNIFIFNLIIVFACATLDKVFIFDLNVDKIGKLAE